jgi:hypothetical protein
MLANYYRFLAGMLAVVESLSAAVGSEARVTGGGADKYLKACSSNPATAGEICAIDSGRNFIPGSRVPVARCEWDT